VTAAGATFAGTTSGDVFKLSGSTWSNAGHPGTGPVHNIAIDPYHTNIVYANVDDKSAWNQNLYATIDGGTTWKEIFCNCSIGPQALAASAVVPDRMYLGDDGGGAIYYFTADGNQFPTLNYGAQPYGVDMRYIFVAPSTNNSDDACYLAMDQGLFFAARCTSGTAPPLNLNVPDTLAYDVKVTGNHIIVPLQDNSAAASLDGGTSWNYAGYAAQGGEGGEAFIDPFNPSYCYFAHPDSGLFVSSDGCNNFNYTVSSGAESVTFDPSHAGKVYAIDNADTTFEQIIVSSDYGNSWTNAPWTFTQPYQVAISPTDAKTVLVAAGTNAAPHLYYSHDGGATFHPATGLPLPLAPNQGTIYFPTHRFYVAFPPAALSGTILLADHDPRTNNILVYRSTDNGQTFVKVKTFVEPKPPRPWPHLLFPNSHERPIKQARYYATRFYANRLMFNPKPPTGQKPAVVLTTRFGAFVSFDGGTTWARIDKNAISHHFEGLDWAGGYVYLATYGEGAIRTATRLQ
jgi:hypothetical protein